MQIYNVLLEVRSDSAIRLPDHMTQALRHNAQRNVKRMLGKMQTDMNQAIW